MATATLPDGVLETIVATLEPEEVWLFGSRARGSHDADSDWDLMAVLPDTAPAEKLELVQVWQQLRELRRMRVEVFPIRRSEFDEDRNVLGELAETVTRQGYVVYGRRSEA